MIVFKLFFGLLFGVSVVYASEGFVWTNPEVVIPDQNFAREWVAEFPFKNGTSKAVTIQSIQTCCSCTTWKIDQMKWGAGESGKLTLVFNTEGKRGVQEKVATLKFSDCSTQKVTMKGRIPSLEDSMMVSASQLQWPPHEARVAKKLSVKFQGARKIKILSIKSSDSRFQIKKVHETTQGSEWEIIPPPESERLAAILNIETDFPRKGEEMKAIPLLAM